MASESPLWSLAVQAVRRADIDGATPVLALDRRIGLSVSFVTCLVAALHQASERAVRVEVLLGSSGTLGIWRAAQSGRLARQIARSIPQDLRSMVTVERRTVLSRPAGTRRPLAVGIAGLEEPLPLWASRMRLTVEPSRIDDFQLIPAA